MSPVRSILLVLFIPVVAFKLHAQSVLYGERSLNDSTSVFFDRNGLPYPDYFISDTSLRYSSASLHSWYLLHNEAFIDICALYDYFPEHIDYTSIHRLCDSIIARWAKRINRLAADAPALAFYVHGFRKQFTENGQDVTSVTEFQLFRDHLRTYTTPEPFAVNVYWDGTHDCCFSRDRKRNKELFELYETAVSQALEVGIGLRKLINATTHQRVQLVGHSLGTQVIASALFNPEGTDNLVPTPNRPGRRFSISLIAPAMDATTFHAYYNRSYPVNPAVADPYSLQIIYNEDDFVLRKKDPKLGLFGPGANQYGASGLGCNHRNQLHKLERYFADHFPTSSLQTVDKTELGKCHSWRCYTQERRLQELSDFLWNDWSE